MRILHVVPTYLPARRYGGPIVSVHGLCRALRELGHRVEVFTTSVDGPVDSDVPVGEPVALDDVTVWYFRSRRLRRLYFAPALGQALGQRVADFDIVHVHSLFLWPTLAAARAARRHRVPYVMTPRGMLVRHLIRRRQRWIKTLWIALFDRANLERAAAVHVTSEVEAAEARSFGLRLPPLIVIPNGVDAELLSAGEKPGAVEGGRPGGILFLGRLSWIKGLDRLLRALPACPDARVTIAGNDDEGYTPALRELASRLGVAERVRFTGPVQGADKFALLRDSRVLVLPSYSENFGNVVLEAMAFGLPVVVTSEVGAATFVRETGSGVVVPGDPERLGAALRELLDDPERRERLGRAGRQAARERFSWEAIARRMDDAYREILGRADTHRQSR